MQPIVSERVVRGLEGSEADFPRLEPADRLTEREVEVLRLITGGYSKREIARVGPGDRRDAAKRAEAARRPRTRTD